MSIKVQIGDATLELVQGDITQQEVDGIVNAANAHLAGGGGVDGAIHRVGGPEIMTECRRIGGCPTGRAVATTAGRLKAAKAIHAVGPRYKDGGHGEAGLLASAYRSAFSLAAELGLKTVATPSLSTGAYGYPLDEAAPIAVRTAIEFLEEEPKLELIRFVLFDTETYEAYRRSLEELSPTQKLPAV